MNQRTGLVVVYTGKGKGKTTAALGLSLRAIGHGSKVFMVQFRKGDPDIGELVTIRKYFSSSFDFYQTGRALNKSSFDNKEVSEEDYSLVWNGFIKGKEAVLSGGYDLVILDEINVAMDFGLLPVKNVLDMLEKRPSNVDVVLTGRRAPKEIIDYADLVSEVQEIKHPFQAGVAARSAMEF